MLTGKHTRILHDSTAIRKSLPWLWAAGTALTVMINTSHQKTLVPGLLNYEPHVDHWSYTGKLLAILPERF